MVFRILLFLPIFLSASNPGYFLPWGKDADLILHRDDNPIPPRSTNPLAQAAESVIVFHQNIISPVDGPRSHFRPTSARYMLLSIRRYGFFTGFAKGCDRLMRENKDPWIYRTRVINGKTYKWDPTYR